MTDPYWPALVAAVHAAGTKGVTPEQVIPDAIALIGPDRIGQPAGSPLSDVATALAWRIADLTEHPDHAPGSEGAAPDEHDLFIGTATMHQTPARRQALLDHVQQGFTEGRSLRVLAAENDRSQSAIRRALNERNVPQLGPGAPPSGRSHRKNHR